MRACLGRLPSGSLKGKEADMGEKDVSEQQQVAADQAQEIEDTGQAAFGAGELPE